jgi:hypothetical protein
MAKKSGGPNKSDAIRKYKAHNSGAGPTAIAEGLSKDGIKVSPAFVSTVLSNDRRKGRKGRRGRRSGGRRAAGSRSLGNLLLAKKLAERMGGVDAARQALDTLAKLLG